jgi:hypothetical protein
MLVELDNDESTLQKYIKAGNDVMTSGSYKPVFTKTQAVELAESWMTGFVD